MQNQFNIRYFNKEEIAKIERYDWIRSFESNRVADFKPYLNIYESSRCFKYAFFMNYHLYDIE